MEELVVPSGESAPKEEVRSQISLRGRMGRWLGQERVFRLIPFIMVEATFLLFLAVPFITTIYIAFLKWRANRPFEQAYFHGVSNFVKVLTTPDFWASVGRTFYFAGVAVSLELLIGFFMALLLYKEFRGRKIYITIFLMPMMVVPVVVGYNFSMIYVDSGPLNQVLAPFLELFGLNPRIRWLSYPLAAQWAVILAVDLAHVPHFSIRLLCPPRAAHERGPHPGSEPLADFLADPATAAQTGHYDRCGHPDHGGAQAL
jgi:multiple sugar transport system permease protein